MNLTNVNQILWDNIVMCSPIEEICALMNTTLLSQKSADIENMLNTIVALKLPQEKLVTIIETVEAYFIEGCAVDLSIYLALLYYTARCEYMSKYYIGLITELSEEQKLLIAPIIEALQEKPKRLSSVQSVSLYDFTKRYVYQEENREYSIHSFSQVIGKNATVLKTPYGAIMFDCGAACGAEGADLITEIELLEFFKRIDISPDDLLAVVISHAHMDHYGSIATLINLGIEMNRIYIEYGTKKLIQSVALDMPYLEEALPVNAFFVPFQKVKITAFPNGHILGSCGYIVTFDGRNVIYTGDYCLHNQRTAVGLQVKNLLQNPDILHYGVDCLITETTYGKYAAPIKYKDVCKVFLHFVELLKKHGYKIFLPSFAIGRSQEIALLLNSNYNVLIDGLATKISRVYEELSGLTIFNRNTRYNDSISDYKEDNFDFNDIIIASSGMLAQNSTSYNYIKNLLESERKVAIIKTGYIGSESFGNVLLNRWKNQENKLFDISLSAHADFDEIHALIEALEPVHLVCIHGDGLKEAAASDTLAEKYEDVSEENESVLLIMEIEQAVIEEFFSEDNKEVLLLIERYLEAVESVPKRERYKLLEGKSIAISAAYQELYSYVRLLRRYKAFYEALYELGIHQKKIYCYLRNVKRIVDEGR
ncbi:MAG: MBL fold metallo-hydrolase [Lachnospiraceae bacterium]|nr:MBL fold metallo-hydrolase [Lachnospiraceae bacterium]